MQQTTLMCIKSNLETMNRLENDRRSCNVTGLTAVNNGTVPVRWPLANPNANTGLELSTPGLEKTAGFANPTYGWPPGAWSARMYRRIANRTYPNFLQHISLLRRKSSFISPQFNNNNKKRQFIRRRNTAWVTTRFVFIQITVHCYI